MNFSFINSIGSLTGEIRWSNVVILWDWVRFVLILISYLIWCSWILSCKLLYCIVGVRITGILMRSRRSRSAVLRKGVELHLEDQTPAGFNEPDSFQPYESGLKIALIVTNPAIYYWCWLLPCSFYDYYVARASCNCIDYFLNYSGDFYFWILIIFGVNLLNILKV